MKSMVFGLPIGLPQSLPISLVGNSGSSGLPSNPDFIITEAGEDVITESSGDFMITEN